MFGSTRNVVLQNGGTFTDNGQRLQVYGDTLLRGSGATSATTALTVQNSSSTNLFTVRNDGNVGIGTTSPGRTLVVDGKAAGGVLQITNNTAGNTAGNGLELVSAGLDAFISVKNNGYLGFGTNNTERMRLTSAGRLLVGTTTESTYLLDVSGDIRNTTSAYFATSSGNVGIGNTSASYRLDVTGGVRSTTSSFFATGSGVVSIGSTSGNGKLFVVDDVDGDVTINFQNNNAGSSARVRLGFNSAGGAWFLTHPRTGGNFSIFNDTNEFVTITRTSGNLGLGQTTFGTSATKTLAIGSGTAPTTSPADAFQMYSADITAGNAAAHFRTENGAVIKLYQETTGVGAATLVGNAGTNITDTDTFDGYTLKQIVKALRNQGILA